MSRKASAAPQSRVAHGVRAELGDGLERRAQVVAPGQVSRVRPAAREAAALLCQRVQREQLERVTVVVVDLADRRVDGFDVLVNVNVT